MSGAKSNLDGMTPLEIVNVDSKIYSFTDPDGVSFDLRLSVIESTIPDKLYAMADKLGKACDEQLAIDQKKRSDLPHDLRAVLFFVIEVTVGKGTFLPSSSEYAKQLVLVGEFPEVNGTPQEDPSTGFIELDGLKSRKLQILPGITVSSPKVPFDNNLNTKNTGGRSLRGFA